MNDGMIMNLAEAGKPDAFATGMFLMGYTGAVYQVRTVTETRTFKPIKQITYTATLFDGKSEKQINVTPVNVHLGRGGFSERAVAYQNDDYVPICTSQLLALANHY